MGIRTEATPTITPPRMIPAIAAGFNTVANHIGLILLPVSLDLLVWFGPHLRVKALLLPLVTELNNQILSVSGPETANLVKATQEIWQEMLEKYNLVSLLRTFPIGIPSLMTSRGAVQNPLGLAPTFEMSTVLGVLGIWLFLSLLGIFIGCLYFNAIARATALSNSGFKPQVILGQFFQILLFTVSLMILALMMFVPISILLSLVMMISPTFAEIALLFIGLLVLWLFLPLVFAPHGIFVFNQNLVATSITSLRLVRFFLPGTGLFLLIAVLIGQGLDIIWRVPAESSWMQIIGVFGHAFISTSLIASTFIYYRSGLAWMQENLRQHAEAQKARI